MNWVGLDFFLTHHGGLGWKNFSTRPMLVPVRNHQESRNSINKIELFFYFKKRLITHWPLNYWAHLNTPLLNYKINLSPPNKGHLKKKEKRVYPLPTKQWLVHILIYFKKRLVSNPLPWSVRWLLSKTPKKMRHTPDIDRRFVES